jgi:hypothetical protein
MTGSHEVRGSIPLSSTINKSSVIRDCPKRLEKSGLFFFEQAVAFKKTPCRAERKAVGGYALKLQTIFFHLANN